jgi:hypothetical protein
VLEPPAFSADLSRLKAELDKSNRVSNPILILKA